MLNRMRTYCLLLASSACATTVWAAERDLEPSLEFADTVCCLGRIAVGSGCHECRFEFTNRSDSTVSIVGALSACGCTVPTYTKDPIKPGEKGTIEVTYNGQGKFPGKFRKTITVRTNAKDTAVSRLSIEGTMTEAK